MGTQDNLGFVVYQVLNGRQAGANPAVIGDHTGILIHRDIKVTLTNTRLSLTSMSLIVSLSISPLQNNYVVFLPDEPADGITGNKGKTVSRFPVRLNRILNV